VLIDNYLPKYDERVRHQTRVAATTAEAYAALRAVDVHRSMVVRMLVAIRRLPSHVGVRERPRSHLKSARSLLESMLDLGWEILEETPGREVVVGTVTQPWRSAVQFRGLTPREFVNFAEPGFAKIVMNLAADECAEGGSILSTETRVLATSPGARRRFRLYWRVVRPGVKMIRRIALTRACRELRRAQKRRRKSSKLILN
jgi:hypothetical protein